MKTSINMVKSTPNDNGVYRYDGNSIIADVTEQSLVSGTFIKEIKFFERSGLLRIYLSDGSSPIEISNFLKIDDLEVVAELKRGQAGPNGLDGRNGMDGKDGLDGQIGDQGPVGEMGPPGLQGIEGPIGDYGLEGPQGPVGADGLQGQQGPRGEVGNKGQIGESGINGRRNILVSRFAPDPVLYEGITNPIWVTT